MQRESKFKPEDFVDMMMFTDLDHNKLSLQDCCNDLLQQRHKSLSKAGLNKRFNDNSLKFLKAVLAEQMATRLNVDNTNCWKTFSRVLIADSCKFVLPDQYQEIYPGFGGCRGGKSLMNIQYSFDIKNGDWEHLELTKATQNDQSHSRKTLDNIQPGDFHIRDLGFVIHDYMLNIIKQKAFFLNRLHPKCNPIQTANSKQIEWKALYQHMQSTRETLFETEVKIGEGKRAFCCRLVAVPIPEEIWSERIRKAQKQMESQGYALSEGYRSRARFNIFITNVAELDLKTADIAGLYQLRWQIELIFKNWKSLFNIHKVKAVKRERLECQLVAKFIWIIVNWKVFRCMDASIQKHSPDYALSMWKFSKHMRKYSATLRSIATALLSFKDWCSLFICPIIKTLLIEPKKGKKPAFMIINDIQSA